MRRVWFLFCLLLSTAGSVTAEPITYICNYTSYSDSKGNRPVESEFKLTYVIDKETKKAYMLGNKGSSDVVSVEKEDRISFIEVTGTGNISTTTIAKSMKSVHSRNMIVFGDLIATQYYGVCEVK